MTVRILCCAAIAAGLTAPAFAVASAQSNGEAARAASAQQSATANQSLDSLLSIHISSASKYSQTSAEAPSSVTIVTSEQIATFGYRNLHEALEGVRGLYVSNDRNYPYLGTRGFSRPTDYNNRILLLVDGHTINEQIWGSAPVGSDLPINLAAVERIEIVRGPGSAMYGTSAMFGVINIVTKTGAELDGVRIRGGAGSSGAREAAIAAGKSFGTLGWYAVSAIVSRSDGNDLYFRELDSPATENGFSRGLDWEEANGALGSVSMGGLSARGGFRQRSKGIPTGAYGVSLSDSRSETMDQSMWGELSAHSQGHGTHEISARVYADRYTYRGVYASDPAPAYRDAGESLQVGGEATFLWDLNSRVRVTLGSEFRDVLNAGYYERYADGSQNSSEDSFSISSFFAQSAFDVTSSVTLVTGLRHDRRSANKQATMPRLAAIFAPDARTTLKVVYGGSYRAPSVSEAALSSGYYIPNAALDPETMRTVEMEMQRRVSTPLLLGISAYKYDVSDLIEQVYLETEGGVQHQNIAAASASGVEFQADWLPAGILSAHGSYTLQVATSEPSEARLSNSPSQIANLQIAARAQTGVYSSLALRYESGRGTVSGGNTESFVRADVNAGWSMVGNSFPGFLRAADLSVRVTNIFDQSYAVPGGVEHAQSTIPQNGRAWSLRLDWRL